jgi:hypothetical protein
MDQQHYRVAMAKDIYFSALLTLLLRAIIDDNLPSYSELELLLAFLLHAETAGRIHNSFFTEALSDWVTRMIKGIEAATFTPSGHMRRSRILESETPSLSLSTPPSSFTALLNDAIGKETVIIPTPSTPPRFKVRAINDHDIDGRGRLSFNVQWEGEGSLDTQEPYSELHHLDALDAYDLSIRPALSSGAAATKWSVYQLQKGVELLELVSEDDTDSDISETVDPATLDLDVDSYLLDMPLPPLMDMTLPPLLDSPGSSADFWKGGSWDLDLSLDFNFGSTFP